MMHLVYQQVCHRVSKNIIAISKAGLSLYFGPVVSPKMASLIGFLLEDVMQ